jgi:hypothetical protein
MKECEIAYPNYEWTLQDTLSEGHAVKLLGLSIWLRRLLVLPCLLMNYRIGFGSVCGAKKGSNQEGSHIGLLCHAFFGSTKCHQLPIPSH